MYFEMKRVLNLKTKQEIYFAGGLVSENFMRCKHAGIRKLSLALYHEMTSLQGM